MGTRHGEAAHPSVLVVPKRPRVKYFLPVRLTLQDEPSAAHHQWR